ncbi:MAG: glutamate-5-semialdehyde dehydrogenase [Oscillospiraceae bacterium]|nr:glutamate-5-semialdehyde dehydrogenase [Oscillospiraceae bacterium]
MQELIHLGKAAQCAAQKLATLGTDTKNAALLAMADALVSHTEFIMSENEKDLAAGRAAGMSVSLLDRLALSPERIAAMADGIRQIAALPDPIGEVLQETTRPNGLKIDKVRVPLGVIAIIYEARPNVTADAAALCLKAGNAVILRGGKEAIHSNAAIEKVMLEAAVAAGMPQGCMALVKDTTRDSANFLMRMNEYVDVIIPRGGAGLIRAVVENATVPAIETGTGNCHVYVDKDADLAMAAEIVMNAKTSRPSVCNAEEKLLVHKDVAAEFLPMILPRLADAGVEIRGGECVRAIYPTATPVTDDDWKTEYLDLIIAVRIVNDLETAIAHINEHGSKHSEAIVTGNSENSRKFLDEVDAAAVYVNASTRFTDGFEFGFGAEIGISTQKMHARGPMGLSELTTIKYVVYGTGQVR